MGCFKSKEKSPSIEFSHLPILKSGFDLDPKDFVIHHTGKFRDEYEKIITIGKGNNREKQYKYIGAYGEVQKVQHKKTRMVRAVKIIKKEQYTPEEAELVLEEAIILGKLVAKSMSSNNLGSS
jgi:hypothetical protein